LAPSSPAEAGRGALETGLGLIWDDLRGQGLRLSPGQLADARRIVGFLAGPDGGDVDRATLARMVGGVFAKSQGELDLFTAAFSARIGGAEQKPQTARPPTPATARRSGHWTEALAGAELLGAIALVGVTPFLQPPTVIVTPPCTPTCPPAQPAPPAPPTSGLSASLSTKSVTFQIPDPPRWWDYAPTVAATAVLLLTVITAVLWSRRRRPGWMSLTPDQQEVAIEGVRPPKSTATLFDGPETRAIARSLRRARLSQAETLDVLGTVEASARNLGLFTPVRSGRPSGRSGVGLVEQLASHDHLAALYREALERVRDYGAQVQTLHYRGPPMQVRDENGRSTSMAQLLAEDQEAAVLLFGDGLGLMEIGTDRISETQRRELSISNHRYVASTRPLTAWGDREEQIVQAGFTVAPATAAGLGAIAASLENEAPNATFVGVRIVDPEAGS
jgi:hypothetical protein